MGRTAGGNVAERTLLGMSLFALAALAAGLIATAPAAASAPAGEAIGGADKLHGLDMMLIATSAHCDVSGQGFASDYQRFAERHAAEISAADAELMAAYVNAHGPAGGAALFERSSTAIANRYGQGHPWLSCGDLKLAARNLAEARGRATLEEAADQLLGVSRTARIASAQR